MLATLGFAALSGLARTIPLATGYALARAGARWHHRLAPGRRARIAANLEVARRFGKEVDALPTLDRLVDQAFASHAVHLFEWLRASGGSRLPLDLEGEDHLARALDAGRGAILATCHLGSWEAAALALAARGYPLTVVTGEQLGGLASAVRDSKAGQGIAVVRPLAGMRATYRAISRNRILVLLLDGDVWRRGRPIAFLGRPAVLPWGAVRLARSTGAPLLPAVMQPAARGRLRARVFPALDLTRDPAASMRALLAPLEAAIAADPGEWCLFRPLWSPAGGAH
jgi:KDO2-lipid IV(A) lauroyltransferase